MNKTILLFILFFSCGFLLAQEQVNYFPLAVGNRWVYTKPSFRMTITRDTIMDNGKKYYIFEYIPHYMEYFFGPISSETRIDNFFTPRDPVRIDENGDIYAYNDSTQNEYLYLKFSDKQFRGIFNFDPNSYDRVFGTEFNLGHNNVGVFQNHIGMITIYDNLADCWGTVWDPCPPFEGRANVLVYAIINGEKVYSIEESEEYLDYIRTYDVKTATQPQQIELHQNYPNPFNPETRIDFEIPKTEKVKLVIYNVLGKEIKTVLDDELHAGKYSTTWNGKDDMNNKVSSGIYFYRLTFGNNIQSITKKMIILK